MDTATQTRVDDYLEVYERANSVVKSAEVTAADLSGWEISIPCGKVRPRWTGTEPLWIPL